MGYKWPLLYTHNCKFLEYSHKSIH